MLPFALATDASGGEPDQPGDEEDAGGFGAALAASDEWSVREEFSKAERRGAYVRLSPGKVDTETWAEALEVCGLQSTQTFEDQLPRSRLERQV